MLRLGHGQRQVVLVLYSWVGVVALGAVGATVFPPVVALVVFLVAFVIVGVVTWVPLLRNRSRDAVPDRG